MTRDPGPPLPAAAVDRETCKLGFAKCAGYEWDQLTATATAGVRFCERCQGEVHLAGAGRDYAALAARGLCIAEPYNAGVES